MNVRREDVILARFPHASGERGKKRPVVVVQADGYNQRLRQAVVAQVTSNLDDSHDPACLLIDVNSSAGKATGLSHDCLVSCYMLSLMSEDRLQNVIGRLSPKMLADLDDRLKVAMGIA